MSPKILACLLVAVTCCTVQSAPASDAPAKEEAPPKAFDIPSGPAETALKKFSDQAGIEVIFATQQVADINTPSIKGRFKSPEALTRLLTGTPLIAKTDPRTGSIIISREEPNDPKDEGAAPVAAVSRPTDDNLDTAESKAALKLNEFIVTGVFEGVEKSKASVAISTLDASDIELLVPNSASDLLTNIPGVFVDSSQGVIQFGSGGQNTGASFLAARGLGYVQTEEDGLPLIGEGGIFQAGEIPSNGTLFLRADETLDHIEAVRGGSAAITGANAPGGLFNYISKTGGDVLSASLSGTYGMQANGTLPYERVDLDVGGPAAPGGWYYNLGGYYQHDYGARDAGYPLDFGGQLKANLLKKFKNGSVELYGKYLDDHNAYAQPEPGVDWGSPHPAPGWSNTSSTLINPVSYQYQGGDGNYHTFNNQNLDHLIVESIGARFDLNPAETWSINGNFKYADSHSYLSMTANGFQDTVDDILPALFLGTSGIAGTYTYTDLATGQSAKVLSKTGSDFTVLSSNLPGGNVVPNAVLFEDALDIKSWSNEWQGQLSVTKQFKNLKLGSVSLGNMSFTAGAYGDHSYTGYFQPDAGFGFATFSAKPQMLNVTLQTPAGQMLQLTNPAGFGGPGFGGNYEFGSWNQLDTFLAQHWEIGGWTFDSGLRYENDRSDGFENVGSPVVTTSNSNNIYQDSYSPFGAANETVINFHTLSYSLALNRKLNANNSVYVRYTLGKNAPGFTAFPTQAQAQQSPPLPQKISQWEMGYKFDKPRYSIAITPFYSVLTQTSFDSLVGYTNGNSGEERVYYVLTPANQTRDMGVEIDSHIYLDYGFSLKAALTGQASKEISSYSWFQPANVVGTSAVPTQGAILTDVNAGNEAQNIPPFLASLTPAYSKGPFLAQVQWQYVGAIEVNNNDAYKLPAYQQTNLTLQWRFTPRLTLTLTEKNLFNGGGVTEWGAPGTLLTGYLQSANYTSAQRLANPNAVFEILQIPARAYFIRLSYKL